MSKGNLLGRLAAKEKDVPLSRLVAKETEHLELAKQKKTEVDQAYVKAAERIVGELEKLFDETAKFLLDGDFKLYRYRNVGFYNFFGRRDKDLYYKHIRLENDYLMGYRLYVNERGEWFCKYRTRETAHYSPKLGLPGWVPNLTLKDGLVFDMRIFRVPEAELEELVEQVVAETKRSVVEQLADQTVGVGWGLRGAGLR